MHIWPSASIRESFKVAYLSKVERNLQRMKMEKKQQQSSANQSLLEKQNCSDSVKAETSNSKNPGCGIVAFCHDLCLLLSCCCCCFCCGACVEEK